MSEPSTQQRLVVVILSKAQLVDELITGFLDMGVSGATVVESRGMGQIIRQDMPMFAGLVSLFPETTGSRTVMSVVPEEMVDQIFDLVDEIVGDLEGANSGVCFSLPVDKFRGVRKK